MKSNALNEFKKTKGITRVNNFAIKSAGRRSTSLLKRITTALPPINIAVSNPKKSPNTQDLPDITKLTYGANIISRKKMINNNNEHYEYVLSLEKKIKGYSSKELVEKPPALLVYHIHLMLIEYASQSSIKFEEDFDKNKKILDIDNLISEIEDKIELSKNIKSKLK